MVEMLTSRRNFVVGSGALIVTFTLGQDAVRAQAPAPGAAPAPVAKPLDEVDSFIALDAEGNATVFSGHVDLGTGVRTALTQMVADELELPLSRVTIVQGDTTLTPDQGITYGSLTIQISGQVIKQAAATARAAMIGLAAKQFGVKPSDCYAYEGTIRARDGRSIRYGALFGGKTFSMKVDKSAPLKKPDAYKKVGKPVARLEIPAIVDGTFTYVQDVRVPGMLHGRVVRPPAVGAALVTYNEGSVQGIPGLVKVVRIGNFLGVVAKTEWAAIKAARQLKAIWSPWSGLPDQAKLWDHVRSTKIVKDDVTSDIGDANAALQRTARTFKATYDFAIQTHGSIGPSCAVAEFKGDNLTVWTASQATHALRKQLAQMLAMPEGNIRCIYVAGSGCYGRNGHEDAAADAVLLAREVHRPVRVQWMRADEHGWDPKGPPTLMDLQAGLDANGNVVAWRGDFIIPPSGALPAGLLAADHAKLPTQTLLEPGNIHQDSQIPYKFPNINTVCRRVETTPFRPSWIRSPGRMQNTFANECFIDELAVAVGSGPLAFRLKYLDDPRGVELLKQLASFAKWDDRVSHSRSKGAAGEISLGRGLAYVKYETVRTYVGAVADVAVSKKTGDVRVTKVAIVHDCGQIINPDGLRNQIEGCVVQTVSRTLKETVTFNRSRVTSIDWKTYPILRFPEVPAVEIDLIDHPEAVPWGAGEPAAVVVPSAISNAIYDAIGVRMRSVPFKPRKVLAALTERRS